MFSRKRLRIHLRVVRFLSETLSKTIQISDNCSQISTKFPVIYIENKEKSNSQSNNVFRDHAKNTILSCNFSRGLAITYSRNQFPLDLLQLPFNQATLIGGGVGIFGIAPSQRKILKIPPQNFGKIF